MILMSQSLAIKLVKRLEIITIGIAEGGGGDTFP